MATEKKTTTVSPSSVKEPSVAVKTEPKKAVAEKAEPKKAAPKKAAAKKPAAKKAAPKKATAVKATAKKVAETLVIQAAGNEWDVDAVKEQVIAAYVAAGHQRSGISSLTVYIKPEERKAYYVINGKTSGSADI
ncbi:MAG: hypothetical protein K1W04_03330 [Oscillospiraceae bacterium]